MTDLIKVVKQFTEAVGCTTDQFNVRQTALYTGLQFEEMAEKFEAIFGSCPIVDQMHSFANEFKKGVYDNDIAKADRAAMLDADIDLAWVTIGSALSQGADVEGAAGEVARANLSKLVPCPATFPISSCNDGMNMRTGEDCTSCNGTGLVAIKDANGKVKKPQGWTAPHIAPFVCKEKNT